MSQQRTISQLNQSIHPCWCPDSDMNICTACSQEFSTFNRRHHCRADGLLYCNSCSQWRVSLPKYGYHDKVRVCNLCYKAEKSRLNWLSALKPQLINGLSLKKRKKDSPQPQPLYLFLSRSEDRLKWGDKKRLAAELAEPSAFSTIFPESYIQQNNKASVLISEIQAIETQLLSILIQRQDSSKMLEFEAASITERDSAVAILNSALLYTENSPHNKITFTLNNNDWKLRKAEFLSYYNRNDREEEEAKAVKFQRAQQQILQQSNNIYNSNNHEEQTDNNMGSNNTEVTNNGNHSKISRNSSSISSINQHSAAQRLSKINNIGSITFNNNNSPQLTGLSFDSTNPSDSDYESDANNSTRNNLTIDQEDN
jgi:hypothetical protein